MTVMNPREELDHLELVPGVPQPGPAPRLPNKESSPLNYVEINRMKSVVVHNDLHKVYSISRKRETYLVGDDFSVF